MPAAPDAGDRSVPVVVAGVSLLCSVAFLHALVLESHELTRWVERWGLVSREVVRALREGGPAWRLLTPWSAMLLHASLLHLVANLFYLWLVGEALEPLLGSARFGLLLLLSGLAAAGVHVIARPDAFAPALGASGAISGLLGAYLLVHRSLPRRRRWHPLGLPPLFYVAGWGILLGLAAALGSEGYAAWAHVGGLAAGALLGAGLRPRSAPEPA